jgi:hypothetical protein
MKTYEWERGISYKTRRKNAGKGQEETFGMEEFSTQEPKNLKVDYTFYTLLVTN